MRLRRFRTRSDLERLRLIEKRAGGGTHVYALAARGEGRRPVLDALHGRGGVVAGELPVTIRPALLEDRR